MVKRKGHTSFETAITVFIISIAVVILANLGRGYIQDAKVTKSIAEVNEEDKAIKETIISIYSNKTFNNSEDKLTGEYIVKKIKRNSNDSLQIYVYGEANPTCNEDDADIVIYLRMQNDDGTISNPVKDEDISKDELLSIEAYHIVGKYGVYIYDDELYKP